QLLKDGFVVNTILKEADLFCPNSVRINFTIYLLITYISGKLADFNKKQALIFSLMYGLSIYRFSDLVNRQAIGEVSTGIGICYQ
ncbi:hypothetical protein EFR49_07085, partial [Latilactobacillus curvatus]|nr:hypothetical protein [Latilactobacillus curvatus]